MGSILDRLSGLADRYQVDREIGHGGMATVYRARDLNHDRSAIKVLRPEPAQAMGAQRLYVGNIAGWPGAHSQGETLDELQHNVEEVVAMLLEDAAPSSRSRHDDRHPQHGVIT